MALTDEQRLDALEDAYFSGVLEVTYGDRTTRYRSLEDIGKAIDRLKDRMGLSDRSKSGSQLYASFSKDL